jgi:hypothetical protein
MGLNAHGVRFLLHARRLGADFSRTATLGRQRLDIRAGELRKASRAFSVPATDDALVRIVGGADGYAEELFRWLGAADVHSFDYSSYEGASHLHDMNQPIPEAFKAGYGVVLDGGSLEHVFDFPTAVRNCMQMLAVGGHYIGISPTNNFMGHGFYQFSPELYSAVFSPSNGFRLLCMVAVEDRWLARWYRVKEPHEIGGRVTLQNCRPVNLMVLARRVADVPIFATPPQQSDYVALWSRPAMPPATLVGRIMARMPPWLRMSLWKLLRAPGPGFHRRFFEPFDPTR